ncbi:MAG TPA: hypothetical protein VNH20_00060 [Candidatus Dormibacteraeota bacterium]|nr:hypothetical protein [Candidatus Dormibacteraeota bacterium]
MSQRVPLPRSVPTEWPAEGPVGNQRLTSSVAVVLLVLLAVEGATLLNLGPAIRVHVFVGMMLLPPVALKLASTGYRLIRYYAGAAAYVRRGTPILLARLLGPVVVFLTVLLLATGVALLYVPPGHGLLVTAHKASFVLWFGAMSLHVLLHIFELPQSGVQDWLPRTKRIAGVISRREVVLGSVLIGAVVGFIFLPGATPWQHWLAGFGAGSG